MKAEIVIITAEEIEGSFEKSDRQYFVGNLFNEQILDNVEDNDVEIGISDYQKDTLDKPHFHPVIAEYQYILKGEIILFDLDHLKSFHLKKGDFYAIPINVKHVQVSKANSRILFVKNKSINDKEMIKVNEDVMDWIHRVWNGELR